MKAIFVACNQSIYDEVLDIMNRMQMRGYTGWEELMGCGSRNGEPHLGNHAWLEGIRLGCGDDDLTDAARGFRMVVEIIGRRAGRE